MRKDQNSKILIGDWSPDYWQKTESNVLEKIASINNKKDKFNCAIQFSRKVLKVHSTSFFIVTRFLPKSKRDDVELIYGSVRYPDEIVDSFDISPQEKRDLLDSWKEYYKISLTTSSFTESINKGVPVLLAGFAETIKKYQIPTDYYLSFLEAMELDVEPRNFKTIDDLIDNYIYGSAIVVGYFLAYVYGNSPGEDFKKTLKSSKDLGVALQITNFVRDIHEDAYRGRVYIPETILEECHISSNKFFQLLGEDDENILMARKHLAEIADSYYKESSKGIDSFSEDSRIAIKSCIDLYGKLNSRIITSANSLAFRESLSWSEKLGSLPSTKYWKLPLAYLKS